MTLTRPLIVVVVLLGALSLAATSFTVRAAEARPSAKAIAEIVATGFRKGASPWLQKVGASDASIRCLRGLTGDDFAQAVEDLLADSLTPAEIAEMDAYFTSPLGGREFKVTVTTMRRQAGDEVPHAPALTEEEREQVTAFYDSAVVSKFTDALDSSMNSPDVPGTVGHRILTLVGECGVL